MSKRFLTILLCFICPGAVLSLRAEMPWYANARALGMGGAFSTLADDSSGLYWNPACLGALEGKDISLFYGADMIDVRYGFIAYGCPLPERGGLALGWARSWSDFEKTDDLENTLGTAGVSNDVFLAGLGYTGKLPVSVGLTAKFVRENIDAFSLAGWGIDGGIFYEAAPLRFAVTGQNIVSGGLTGTTTGGKPLKENLPSSFRTGISLPEIGTYRVGPSGKTLVSIGAAVDVTFPDERAPRFGFHPGGEIWVNDTVGIRAGSIGLRDYTAGLSLHTPNFRFDYALILGRYLGNKQVISTSFLF